MSAQETPVAVVVLAAIERAELHRAGETPGVPGWVILEHLDIARRSMRARRVRGLLDVLQADGLVERGRRHGVATWTLTAAGCQRLSRARRAGEVELPESPQHRTWRNARAVAGGEIERLRRGVRNGLGEVAEILDADPPADSDAWFLLSDRLRRVLWLMGSASYCLYEWAEPDDECADVDEDPGDEALDPTERARRQALRGGRRNFRPLQDG